MTIGINAPDWKWSSEDVVDQACSCLSMGCSISEVLPLSPLILENFGKVR